MGDHTHACGLNKDRVDLLQAIAHGRKSDVLQAATPGQLIQLIQHGQGTVILHFYRRVEHNDAQVKEVEGVGVILA